MNDKISGELLSAYFDDELSVVQRAEVEAWLADNPEGQQILADYRRLSRLFAEAPREEVPAEFVGKILQQAERQMLLPETTRHRLFQSRRWRWLAIPATAVAAGIAISLSFPGDKPQPKDPEIATTESDSKSVRENLIPPESTRPGPTEVNFNDPPIEVAFVPEIDQASEEINKALQAASAYEDGHRYLPVIGLRGGHSERLALKSFFDKYSIQHVSSTLDSTDSSVEESHAPQAVLVIAADGSSLIEKLIEYVTGQSGHLALEAREPLSVADLDEQSRQQLNFEEQDIAKLARSMIGQSADETSETDVVIQKGRAPENSNDQKSGATPNEIEPLLQSNKKSNVRKSPPRQKGFAQGFQGQTTINSRIPNPDSSVGDTQEPEAQKSGDRDSTSREMRVRIAPGYRSLPLSRGEPPRPDPSPDEVKRADSSSVRTSDPTADVSDDESNSASPATILLLLEPASSPE
jgi:hypothetical protein